MEGKLWLAIQNRQWMVESEAAPSFWGPPVGHRPSAQPFGIAPRALISGRVAGAVPWPGPIGIVGPGTSWPAPCGTKDCGLQPMVSGAPPAVRENTLRAPELANGRHSSREDERDRIKPRLFCQKPFLKLSQDHHQDVDQAQPVDSFCALRPDCLSGNLDQSLGEYWPLSRS